MVSLYLGDTYKLRGGGRGGVSVSGTVLRGAVFSRAPPHPPVSLANFTVVSSTDLTIATSVSLQRETMQVYSHPGTHATPAVKSSKIQNSYL